MKDRPVALAIIGLGRWGKNYLRVLSRNVDVRVAAVVDSSGGCPGIEPLLSRVSFGTDLGLALGPDIDGVVIATPSDTHASIATKLIQAGKPVLVEKPLATSSAGVRDVVNAARGGSTVLVGHLTLFHPVTEWLEKVVASGVIGKVRFLRSRRVSCRAGTSADSALWALGPHDVCLALRLVRNRCVGVRLLTSPRETNAAALKLVFEGEVEAEVQLSRSGPEPERYTEVLGTHGTARIDEMTGDALLRVGASHPRRFQLAGDCILGRQCDHFIRCLRGLEPPRSSVAEGLDVVRALLGLEESGRRGGDLVPLERVARPPQEHDMPNWTKFQV